MAPGYKEIHLLRHVHAEHVHGHGAASPMKETKEKPKVPKFSLPSSSRSPEPGRCRSQFMM